MNQIYIVIAVDTTNALAKNTLEGSLYMADTNQYLGSWQEGNSQLHTVCQNGQVIAWSACSIDANSQVEIEGFNGSIISDSICKPQLSNVFDDNWVGRVETKGNVDNYPYTVSLKIDNKHMSFFACLKVI